MTPKIAEAIYYLVVGTGYVWSVIQLVAGEPFDAFVLFIVTHNFVVYRSQIKELIGEELE